MPKMNWKEEQGMKKVAVVGSFVVDLMARTPHLPEPGETVMGSYFKAGPGGKGFLCKYHFQVRHYHGACHCIPGI